MEMLNLTIYYYLSEHDDVYYVSGKHPHNLGELELETCKLCDKPSGILHFFFEERIADSDGRNEFVQRE